MFKSRENSTAKTSKRDIAVGKLDLIKGAQDYQLYSTWFRELDSLVLQPTQYEAIRYRDELFSDISHVCDAIYEGREHDGDLLRDMLESAQDLSSACGTRETGLQSIVNSLQQTCYPTLRPAV